ncbi:MAG TPA: hypothetical protein PLY87_25780, partial [Planctomycetaceae bacterium]|nr:hypothetical protein [Planctomycetaceae bacterium]
MKWISGEMGRTIASGDSSFEESGGEPGNSYENSRVGTVALVTAHQPFAQGDNTQNQHDGWIEEDNS